MLFRFQLTDQAFALMLRARFQRQDLCVPTAIVPDPDNPTYIDHIDFVGAEPLEVPILQTGTSKLVNLPVTLPYGVNTVVPLSVPTLVLNRTVGVYTTTLYDLNAAGSNAPATTYFPLTLQLAVSVDHTTPNINGTPTPTDQLTISYYGNTLTDQEIEQKLKTTREQLDDTLRSLLPPVSSPLDFSSTFSSLAGSTFQPISVWSGIAASADFSLVEIRVEFASGSTPGVGDAAAWSTFYNNQVDDIVADHDWAFFIDQDLIIGIVSSLVTPSLQKPSSSFRLDSGPSFSWNSSLPGVVTQFSGDAINACECAWGDIDVSEDLTLDVDFSCNEGWLQVDLHLSNSSNQWQLLCCELTAAVLWPWLGLSLTDKTFLGRLEFLGGIIFGPTAVLLAGIGLASSRTPSLPAVSGFQSDPNDPSHLSAQYSVVESLESDDDLFELTFVAGNSDGLVLGGTHTDKNRRPAVIQVAARGFEWTGPSVNCSGQWSGQFTAEAQISITRASGDLDFGLCADPTVTPSSWQANLSIAKSYHPFSATLILSTSTYTPERVSVFIQTTGGLRNITFRPMAPLSAAQEEAFRLEAEAWRLENCFKLVVPWWQYFTKVHPKWAVDPPESDSGKGESQQLWLTSIGGFSAGDRVVFTGQNGETIQTAFASSSGSVRLNGISNTSQIGLVRLPAGEDRGPGVTKPTITQKQVLLSRVASIPLGEPVLAMQGIPGRFSSGILIATRSGVRLFNLDARGTCSMSRAKLGQNLAGALSTGGRLLGWNGAGEVTDLGIAVGLASSPVSAVQRRLSSAGLGLNHAAIVGNELIVLDASSVRSLDSGFTLALTSEISSLSHAGNSSFVVHTTPGEYRLYSQAPSGGFELAAIYERRPWFEGSINVGSWIVTLSDDHKSIEILTVSAQQTL